MRTTVLLLAWLFITHKHSFRCKIFKNLIFRIVIKPSSKIRTTIRSNILKDTSYEDKL